ncbi:MAG TPA: hypothetical protein VMV49_06895 [Candidatus Deferrimicrobium sp.]|nr:hypothetical protein [Candidatus Deferrimicrobium sp.]
MRLGRGLWGTEFRKLLNNLLHRTVRHLQGERVRLHVACLPPQLSILPPVPLPLAKREYGDPAGPRGGARARGAALLPRAAAANEEQGW